MYTEVVIICGYGCHLTPKIREYLQRVAYHLDGVPHALVIPSGGPTNEKSLPGVSEAGIMEQYLRALGVTRVIVCEGGSVTTLQNLRYAREIMRLPQLCKRLSASPKVTIFCDSIRAFKVRYLARRVLRGAALQIIGCDFHRSLRDKLYQFFAATPAEMLSYYFPSLERRMCEARLALNRNRWCFQRIGVRDGTGAFFFSMKFAIMTTTFLWAY